MNYTEKPADTEAISLPKLFTDLANDKLAPVTESGSALGKGDPNILKCTQTKRAFVQFQCSPC